MKIYVLNFKRILKYLTLILLLALLISVISITGMDALGVFTPERELPIYCVDTSEKVAAITFDCAWGEGTEGYQGKIAKIAEQQTSAHRIFTKI